MAIPGLKQKNRNSKREKNMRKRFTLLTILGSLAVATIFSAVAFSRPAAPAPGASGYHIIKTVPVGGDGGWDYVFVDSDARRIYISRGTHVVDLKTLKSLGTVKTDANPDAIIYDSVSKRVFTFNGRGKNATAINAADGTVVGTIALGGRPEFAVADGKGPVYVNNEDTSELHHLDAQTLKELHRWPLAPCKSPSGLAMDLSNRRLFSVCDEKVMAVVNADTGKVVATPAICDGPDASAFDPSTGYVFASCGDGNLTVIHEDSPDKYTVVENVPTKKSARTMGLDLKTHNIFLPAADFDPPAPGERRGKMKPGSFVIVVVSK